MVQVGGADVLRDEGLAYAEALKNDGVEVEVYAYQGLPHCFPGFLVQFEETKTFYERYMRFLEKHVGKE